MAESDNLQYFICRYIKLRYFLGLLIRGRLFKRNRIVIYYINSNRVSILLEKLSNFFIKKNKSFFFTRFNDITKMRNEKGIPLIQASACDDLNVIISKLDKMKLNRGNSVFDCLCEKINPVKEELNLYIKQQVALDTLQDVIIANVACWLNTNKASELCGKAPILLMEKSYWSYLVMDYLKDKNISFKAYRRLSLRRNKGILFMYHFVRLLIELLRTLIAGQKDIKTSGNPKIGIPFYAMENFTNYFDIKNYYLFWFYRSGIDPDNILIYVPEAELKISAEEVSSIKKAGFNIVYCPTRITSNRNSGVPAYQCSLKTASLLIQYVKQIIRMYAYARGKVMREQWKILSLLFIQLPYWEDFFQRNNIRIKFRFHDIFGIRDIAAKLSGAIVLSYHYSNHSDARIVREEVCDTFFIWGELYEKCLSPVHSTCRYLIKTGYVFDYIFNNLKEKAMNLRDSFKISGVSPENTYTSNPPTPFSKGGRGAGINNFHSPLCRFVGRSVSYVIGIFSENLNFYLGKAQMDFYRAILKYIMKHKDIGVVIKPKKASDNMHLRLSDRTNELIDILEKEGRIKILDSNKYPLEAGYASDIVIGVIPDSTAGLECALAGIPMVIYDCTDSRESHPLYATGYGRIIFNNISQLLNAIAENREMPGSIPGFADWSSFLNSIDPFRDGKANQRVAGYIKTLLLASSNGLSKDGVIEAANEAYAKEYGLDKVTSFH